MGSPTKYAMAVGSKIHKRWRDPHGPLRVICEPSEGYVMVRRPGAMPFILSMRELMNAVPHHIHGPFEAVGIGRGSSKKGGTDG